MRIIDRKTEKEITEKEVSSHFIDFLYHNIFGRIFLTCVFARPYFSHLISLYYKSPVSRHKIKPFIKEYGLDKKLLKRKFKSFEEFFCRKENIKISSNDAFLATASGKLRVFRIGKDGNLYIGKNEVKIQIKGNDYNIRKMLKSPIPKWATGGYFLLYRLSMSDCHRYIYPVSGHCIRRRSIAGKLESVRKDAAYWRAFAENKREVEFWKTEVGEMIHIEIGAMLVGHIHNYKKKDFNAGEEKGYFSFGGSSIVEIVSKQVQIDKDILENTAKNFETKIQIGERIGHGKNKKTSNLF